MKNMALMFQGWNGQPMTKKSLFSTWIENNNTLPFTYAIFKAERQGRFCRKGIVPGSISFLFGMRTMLMADGIGSMVERNLSGPVRKMAGDIYTGFQEMELKSLLQRAILTCLIFRALMKYQGTFIIYAVQ